MNGNDRISTGEAIEVGKEVRSMRKVFLKIIGISLIPLIVMAVVVGILESFYFRNIIKDELKEELRTSAYGLSAIYDLRLPGDYEIKDDGIVYKGGEKVSGLFDSLPVELKKTGVVFTFFYGNTRIDTTVTDSEGNSMAGTKLDNDIYKKIFDTGDELFIESTNLGGRSYYGYYVPYRNSDGDIAAIFFAGRLQNDVFSNAKDYTYTILWTVFVVLVIGIIVSLMCTIYIVGVMFRHFRNENDTNLKNLAAKNQLDFMTLVDREVRDPVDTITILSDRILEEETSPAIREQVLGIKEATNSMLISFRSIREYSLLESGRTEDNTDEYEIKKIVDDSCEKVSAGIERKNLAFNVHYDESMPGHLKGDYAKIRQILDNLLENAVKYTYEGSIDLDITYRKITPGKIDLTFTITDTGAGIRKEDAQKLFSSIGKVGDNKNVSIKGTGLGLLICKRLVGILDGRISVESEIGKGSTFKFTVPQDVAGTRTVGESMRHDN